MKPVSSPLPPLRKMPGFFDQVWNQIKRCALLFKRNINTKILETLIIIVSKTFTTAETMLNARTMRQWLWDFMGNDKEVVRKHVVACASISAADKVKDFGIDTENYFFRFWDWVGGRYSVCSAAGAVPISLLYGYNLFEKFLKVRKSQSCLFFCFFLNFA